jgi:uncharacterized protein YcnI
MLRRLVWCTVAGVAALALWSGVAGAHVTVSPSSLPQGTDDAILTFRVPNESTSAAVDGLRIQFPLSHPIVLLSPEAGSGWQVNVQKAALPRPITTDDGTFTSTVSEIDWSGGSIPVGQFGEFNVLAQGIPSGTNQLVFKAIQSYSDGTTVAWIQVPSSAVPDPPHPAPVISLTSAGKSAAPSSAASTSASGSVSSSNTGSNAQSIAALILASFAVVLGVLAVWLARPRLDEGRAGSRRADRSEE